EGAVPVDADDARVATDVAIAGAALEAMPAHDVPLSGDLLANAQPRDAVAQSLDLSGELVTDDEWRLEAALSPMIPIGDMQIRAAHAGVPHGDQPFPRSRNRLRDGLHGQAGRAFFFDDRLHELGDWGKRDGGRVTRSRAGNHHLPGARRR